MDGRPRLKHLRISGKMRKKTVTTILFASSIRSIEKRVGSKEAVMSLSQMNGSNLYQKKILAGASSSILNIVTS